MKFCKILTLLENKMKRGLKIKETKTQTDQDFIRNVFTG